MRYRNKSCWKRFLTSQLENLKVSSEPFDIEERYFIKGVSMLYEDPTARHLVSELLGMYNQIIDAQLNQSESGR